MTTRLTRPHDDRIIAGVAAGIAHRLGVSPLLVRSVFLLLLILPPAAIVPYLLLWIIMPNEPLT